MKLPLHLFLATSPAAGYLLTAPPALRRDHVPRLRPPTRRPYKEPSDGDDAPAADPGADAGRVWSVLAATERWIGASLDRCNRAENARLDAEAERKKKLHFADEAPRSAPRADNPYARKEVSYVCETGEDVAAVVGGVFRRVREARELGEGHGKAAAARMGELGPREGRGASRYRVWRRASAASISVAD